MKYIYFYYKSKWAASHFTYWYTQLSIEVKIYFFCGSFQLSSYNVFTIVKLLLVKLGEIWVKKY
jgi:hypothetical protein